MRKKAVTGNEELERQSPYVAVQLTIYKMRPKYAGQKQMLRRRLDTDHAELETLRAVSTVPPSTTSFMPSMTDEPPPPPPPTMGWMRDLKTSIIWGEQESQLWY